MFWITSSYLPCQVSTEYGLFYVVTKYGYMYVCDMETAACLCISRVSHCVIFCLALNSKTQGIIGVNRDGQVSPPTVGL